MVLPEIAGFPEAEVLDLQALPQLLTVPGALLLNKPADISLLTPMVSMFGASLLLPECWQNIFPEAGVLISSAISGGTFRERLQEAAADTPGRCWLLLEPMCVSFSLPCLSGHGRSAEEPASDNLFFSDSLCCYYTHSSQPDHGTVTLFDTENSLQQKLELAKSLGFRGFVNPAAT